LQLKIRTAVICNSIVVTPNVETDLFVVASASPVQNSEDQRTEQRIRPR